MTTAAIYTRISSDQGREGIGVDAQEVVCRELANEHGLEVFDVYSDNDIGASEKTASTKIRDDYNRLLADAKAGRFRFIIAYSASRLTRRLDELDDFVTLAKPPYGVRVITKVSGDDDLTTADGLMMARFKAVIDAGESHRISERAKASHLARAQKGLVRRSPWRAFGFEEDGITHNEAEAALIKEAIDLVIGGASLREIGRLWESRGVKGTPVWRRGLPKGERVQRTEWNHTDVKDVLFRWKNCGVRSLNEKPVEGPDGYVRGEWEPIYSLEERVAALEEQAKRYVATEAKTGPRATKALLSGLLKCDECWRTLYGNIGTGTRPPMYICTDGRKAHRGIVAAPLELYVQRVVFRYVTERAYFGESEPVPIAPFPGAERLAQVTKQLGETLTAYRSGALDGELAVPLLEEFRREKSELTALQLKHFAKQQPKPKTFTDRPHAMKFYREWREAPIEQRRKLLRSELTAVVIGPGTKGKKGLDQVLSRVRLEWVQPHPIFDGRTAEEAVNEPFTEFFARNFPSEVQPPISDLG